MLQLGLKNFFNVNIITYAQVEFSKAAILNVSMDFLLTALVGLNLKSIRELNFAWELGSEGHTCVQRGKHDSYFTCKYGVQFGYRFSSL